MFWDTYVSTAGIKLAEKHLGPQGRFHQHSGSNTGVGLYTHLAGKFWYGDIRLPEEEEQLKKIANEMQETLYIIPDSDGMDDRPFYEQATHEVSFS